MSVAVRHRWRRVASRTRPVSRRGGVGRRRTGAVVALVLSALRVIQDDGWQGVQIELAGLGEHAISRVADTVLALAIIVTHDAGAAYVQPANVPDLL